MMLKNFLKKYMQPSMDTANLPEFPADEKRRYRIIFSGIVQGVGFRVEVWQIARKLGLTGFAKNLSNGDVYTEMQGQKNKIMYVISYMKSIPRIHIEDVCIDEIEWKEEDEFEVIY